MPRPVAAKFTVSLGHRQQMRRDPSYIHRGIDYACPTGTNVYATAAGKVVHAGTGGLGPAFGIHVVVETDGVFHIYAHLSKALVKVGQVVKAGKRLGKSGATGNLTGAHLHYGEFTTYHYKSDRLPRFSEAPAPYAGKVLAAKPRYRVINPDGAEYRMGPSLKWPIEGRLKHGTEFTGSRSYGLYRRQANPKRWFNAEDISLIRPNGKTRRFKK